MSERGVLGAIYTFYSYKGGVGRSMCLANVAALVASWGRRVLVVDWDLEAPGIEKFFAHAPCHLTRERTNTPGMVDLLSEWEQLHGRFDRDDPRAEPSYPNWQKCLIQVQSPQFKVPIDLITAGLDDGEYRTRLQAINWERLFEDRDVGLLLEHLRNQWASSYDFVFLDSRTGVSDVGGVCTIIMPDTLVVLFTTTEQSIRGTREVVDSARRERGELPLDRERLLAVPVPSRDESDREYELGRQWRDRFAQYFSDLYADWIPRGTSAKEVVHKLNIPYVTVWSFGERLPVLEPEALTDPRGIAAAYARLASLLDNRLDWLAVTGGADAAELAAYRSQAAASAAKLETQLSKARLYRRLIAVLAAAAAVIALIAVVLLQRRSHVTGPPSAGSATGPGGTDEPGMPTLPEVEADMQFVEERVADYVAITRALAEVPASSIQNWADAVENQGPAKDQINSILTSVHNRLLVLRSPDPKLQTRLEAARNALNIASNAYVSVLASVLASSEEQRQQRAPNDWQHWRTGFARLLSRDLETARLEFEQALVANPRSAPAKYSIARLSILASNDVAAKVDLSKAVELDRTFVPALVELGLLALRQGELPNALSYFSRAAALRKSDRSIIRYTGLATERAQKGALDAGSLRFEVTGKLDVDRIAASGSITDMNQHPSNRQYFATKIGLGPDTPRRNEIAKVEYFFNHSSFGDEARAVAFSPGDRFATRYSLWGCIDDVEISIVLFDRAVLRQKLNLCQTEGWKQMVSRARSAGR